MTHHQNCSITATMIFVVITNCLSVRSLNNIAIYLQLDNVQYNRATTSASTHVNALKANDSNVPIAMLCNLLISAVKQRRPDSVHPAGHLLR